MSLNKNRNGAVSQSVSSTSLVPSVSRNIGDDVESMAMPRDEWLSSGMSTAEAAEVRNTCRQQNLCGRVACCTKASIQCSNIVYGTLMTTAALKVTGRAHIGLIYIVVFPSQIEHLATCISLG